jgi:predicted ATPase
VELGLEPGPELQQLERAILRQDPELSTPETAPAARAALPLPASPLVGREQELAWACALVRRPDVRLLTIIGAGGIGKTRLALELARELVGTFDDGAAFVSLGTIADPELVVPTIAKMLGPPAVPGSIDTERLRNYLADRSLLLVLDSFEQLLDAAPVVSDLLAAAPGVKIVVTSRAVLRVAGEYNFDLPPLELPPPSATPAELEAVPSVALFVQRAQAVVSDFVLSDENASAVAELCRRLEGIPLAIELAARRTKLIAPGPMLARLSQRFDLLAGGLRDAPARQQTLRATIDWSYELLDADEQVLFARLAVFVGGCTLTSAEAVCGDVIVGLESLVDKSLLRRRGGDERRFVMLDTVREYALERLTARREIDVLRRRHAGHFSALAETAEPELTGPHQAARFDQLEEEHDNLRAALAWLLESGDPEPALRLATALTRFWDVRGYRGEGTRWLKAALSAHPPEATAARAKALRMLALLAVREGRGGEAIPWIEESLRILREREPDKVGPALLVLCQAHLLSGDYECAADIARQALQMAEDIGDRRAIAVALDAAGNVALVSGQFDDARRYFEQSAAMTEEVDDRQLLAAVLHNLACALMEVGLLDEAVRTLRRSLRISRDVGFRLELVYCLEACAALLVSTAEYRSAARLVGAAERVAELERVVVAEPYEAATQRKARRALEDELGAAEFAAARAAGRMLSAEAALDEALAVLDELSLISTPRA